MGDITAYKKLRILGRGMLSKRGAYGQALLAEKNGKQFVLKEVVLSGRSRADQEDAAKEVKILRMVKHFNIIMYHDSAVESGSLWIVMELAKDGDLFELVDAVKKKKRVIMEPQFLGMFVQIVLAIHYLHHEHHILHRDLKSKNIFLGGHRQVADGVVVPVVKVGDFGIAKMLDGSMELAKTQIGTPYYLSPEICRDQPYGRKSDIWAMGCLLYEMIALRVPFNGKDLRSLAAEILKRRTPSLPRSHRKNIELANLVNQLLSKHADDRPTTTAVLETPYISSHVSFWLAVANGQDPGPIDAAPPKSGRSGGSGGGTVVAPAAPAEGGRRRRQLPKTPMAKKHSSSSLFLEVPSGSANTTPNDSTATYPTASDGSDASAKQTSPSRSCSNGVARSSRSKSPRRGKKEEEDISQQNNNNDNNNNNNAGGAGGSSGSDDWIGMLREKSNAGAGPAEDLPPPPRTPRRQQQQQQQQSTSHTGYTPTSSKAGGYTPTPASPTSPSSLGYSNSSSSPGGVNTPGGKKRRQWNKPERVKFKKHPGARQTNTAMVTSPTVGSGGGGGGGGSGGGSGGSRRDGRYSTDSPSPPSPVSKQFQVSPAKTRARTVSTVSSSPSVTLPWDHSRAAAAISPSLALPMGRESSSSMASPPPPLSVPQHQKEVDFRTQQQQQQYTPVAVNGPDGVPVMALRAHDGSLVQAFVTPSGSVVPAKDGSNEVVLLTAPSRLGLHAHGGAVPRYRPEHRVSDGWGGDRELAKQSYFEAQAQAAENRLRDEEDLGRGRGGGGGGGGGEGRQPYLGAPQTPVRHGRRSPGRGGRSSSISNLKDLNRTAELAKAAHEAYFANQQAAARYQQRHKDERNGNAAAAAALCMDQPYSPSQGQGRGSRAGPRTTSHQQQPPSSRQPSYGDNDGLTPAERARARKSRARETMIQEQQAALERARKQSYMDKQEIKRKHGTVVQKPAQKGKASPTNPNRTAPKRWGSRTESASPSRPTIGTPTIASVDQPRGGGGVGPDLSLTRTISKSDSLVASNDIAALEREIRKDVERLVDATKSARKSGRRGAAPS